MFCFILRGGCHVTHLPINIMSVPECTGKDGSQRVFDDDLKASLLADIRAINYRGLPGLLKTLFQGSSDLLEYF